MIAAKPVLFILISVSNVIFIKFVTSIPGSNVEFERQNLSTSFHPSLLSVDDEIITCTSKYEKILLFILSLNRFKNCYYLICRTF